MGLSFTEKLKQLRKKKGITQRQFAETIPTSFSTVRRWESGERQPDLDTIIRIAEVLDTSVAFFTGETDDPIRPGEAGISQQTELPESNAHETSIVWVPVVSSEVKVCCGEGDLYPEEVTWEEVGRYPIPFSDIAGYGCISSVNCGSDGAVLTLGGRGP